VRVNDCDGHYSKSLNKLIESPTSIKMPGEVIDLCSSPDPKIRPKPKTSAPRYPENALISEPPTHRNNDGHTLFSDNDLKAPVPATKSKLASTIKSKSNPNNALSPKAAETRKLRNDLFFMSDDFDSTINLSSPQVPKSSPFLGLNRKQMEEERLGRVNKRRNEESWRASSTSHATKYGPNAPYIPSSKPETTLPKPAKPTSSTLNTRSSNSLPVRSDDFDSSIDLDHPFDLPPAKRQRLSPSPKPSKAPIPKDLGCKGSVSSIGPSTKPGMKAPGGQQFKKANAIDLDPIIFTSSPDPVADAARRRKEKEKLSWLYDSDEDLMEEKPPIYDSYGSNSKDASSNESSDIDLPPIISIPSKSKAKTGSKSLEAALRKYNAERAAEKKDRDKAQKAKSKAASKETKEAKKERATLDKQEKNREKQKAAELAKVNNLRTDKKLTNLEMIVDLPSSLDPKLASQTQTFLEKHEIEYSIYESALPIVKWRRKVTSEYKDDDDIWEPVSRRIENEKHVMCVMTAKEFVQLATSDDGTDLDIHAVGLQNQFTHCKIIYLIEGYANWMSKNRNTKNRKFTDAVRSHSNQEEPTATQRRKKKEAEYVDEDLLEEALLKLQVIHKTQIHHTSCMVQTAEIIVSFTQHIYTVPYKYVTLLQREICRLTQRPLGIGINRSIRHFAWNPGKSKPATTLKTPTSGCCKKTYALQPRSHSGFPRNIQQSRSWSKACGVMVHWHWRIA